jgi:CheY-like chemotaxis protein
LKFTFTGYIKIKAELANCGLVKISVSDTGIGIKQEDQKRLFKAFGKLDLGKEMCINSHGVGLGLSISNALAKLLSNSHSSGITLESALGIGSTFSFYLEEKKSSTEPLITDDKIEKLCILPNVNDDEDNLSETKEVQLLYSREKIPSSKFLRKNKDEIEISSVQETKETTCSCSQILVVDDDVFNIMALQHLLKSLCLKCDFAYNGVQAIEKIHQRQNQLCGIECMQYQLIFMDCSMPVLDGFEATVRLREDMNKKVIQRIRIIGCTAFSNEDIIRKCKTSGMEEVLLKPVDKTQLANLVKRYKIK